MRRTRSVSGARASCAVGADCSRGATLRSWPCASAIDVNWWTFRHSSRSRPLNDSMKAFSTGLPGPDEVELHAALIRPVFERPRHELGAVIDGDRARRRARPAAPDPRPRRPSRPTCSKPPLASDSGDSTDRRPSARETAARRPAHHARSPCSSAPSGRPASGAGPRCSAMCLRRRTRMRSCKPSSRYSRRTRFLIHRPALAPQQHPDPHDSRTAAARARARECAAAAPSGPSRRLRRYHAARLNCASRQARTQLTCERRPETSRPARGGVWASDFFSQGLGQHVLVERADRRPAASAAHFRPRADRSRRSSLTPRCAYFFFQM